MSPHDLKSVFSDQQCFSVVPGSPATYSFNVNAQTLIRCDPMVMLGKPTIRGTRITVELVLRKLSEGATVEDLVEAYPQLSEDSIHAAIRYAADTLAHEELVVASA